MSLTVGLCCGHSEILLRVEQSLRGDESEVVLVCRLSPFVGNSENAVPCAGKLGSLGSSVGQKCCSSAWPGLSVLVNSLFSLTQLETWGARGQPSPCAPDV